MTNIFSFTKSYFLMFIVMGIVGIGCFSSCKKDTKTNNNNDRTLSAPTNVSASSSSSSSVTVTWSSVNGATSYNIYRSTSSSGTYILQGNTSNTDYTDNIYSAGIYFYKISAVNNNGESDQSSYAAVTVGANDGGTKPAAPTGVSASSSSSNKATVTWNAVSGITTYDIYRSTSANGTYDLVDIVHTESFTDLYVSAGNTYYYKVTSWNSSYVESEKSSYASVTIGSSGGGIPSAPTGLSASALSSSSISVSWSASSGATSYDVYYEIGSSSTKNFAGNVSGTSYTHTGLSSSTTYYYYIIAKNSSGSSGYSVSSTNYATTSSGGSSTKPSTPTGLSASISGSYANLSWNSVSGATTYYIYWYLNSAPSTFTYLGQSSSTSYSHGPLISGATYYYKVSALNIYGESAQSSYVQAIGGGAPSAPVTITATSVASNTMNVSWASTSGATSYKVYRATSSTGTYSIIANVSGSVAIVDYPPSSGTYYYKVSAVNSSGESALSNYTSAYVTVATKPTTSPTLSSITLSGSSAKITWSAVSGATGYRVYWSNTSSGTYLYLGAIGVVTSTSAYDNYVLSGTNYYKVTAINANGEGPLSSYMSFIY